MSGNKKPMEKNKPSLDFLIFLIDRELAKYPRELLRLSEKQLRIVRVVCVFHGFLPTSQPREAVAADFFVKEQHCQRRISHMLVGYANARITDVDPPQRET
jgi:hypothetical protein